MVCGSIHDFKAIINYILLISVVFFISGKIFTNIYLNDNISS